MLRTFLSSRRKWNPSINPWEVLLGISLGVCTHFIYISRFQFYLKWIICLWSTVPKCQAHGQFAGCSNTLSSNLNFFFNFVPNLYSMFFFVANHVCKVPNDPNYPECAAKVKVRIFLPWKVISSTMWGKYYSVVKDIALFTNSDGTFFIITNGSCYLYD